MFCGRVAAHSFTSCENVMPSADRKKTLGRRVAAAKTYLGLNQMIFFSDLMRAYTSKWAVHSLCLSLKDANSAHPSTHTHKVKYTSAVHFKCALCYFDEK